MADQDQSPKTISDSTPAATPTTPIPSSQPSVPERRYRMCAGVYTGMLPQWPYPPPNPIKESEDYKLALRECNDYIYRYRFRGFPHPRKYPDFFLNKHGLSRTFDEPKVGIEVLEPEPEIKKSAQGIWAEFQSQLRAPRPVGCCINWNMDEIRRIKKKAIEEREREEAEAETKKASENT